jgi:hypothetical protein
MKILAFLSFCLFLAQDLPYKPKEDFEIKLDYQFKQRPVADKNSVHLDETQKERDRRTSASMLPYLIIRINLLNLPEEEVKVRVTSNLHEIVFQKKISKGSSLPLDLGFTDDVKDRVTAHEYQLTFLSPAKKEMSRILLLIEEDGTFIVNGEKRGRF